MVVAVNYTMSGDFASGINTGQLYDEILADTANINIAVIQYININGDDIDVVFDVALTASEQTALDTLVTNHTSELILKKANIGFTECITSSTFYSVVFTFIFSGQDEIGVVNKINLVGKMDSGATNYSIKIFDKTNINIIAETTFTNTEDAILVMDSVSNITDSQAIWEVQLKKTGGDSSQLAHLKSLQLAIN